MKNYKEIAQSIFERRDKYLLKQKKKKRIIIATVTPLLCCSIILATGYGLWESGVLTKGVTIPNDPQSSKSEVDTSKETDNILATNSEAENSVSHETSASTPSNDNAGGTVSQNISSAPDGAVSSEAVSSQPSTASSAASKTAQNSSKTKVDSKPSQNSSKSSQNDSKPSVSSSTPSENTFSDPIFDIPSYSYDQDDYENSDTTSSDVNSVTPDEGGIYLIDSIDKINFYAAKKAISKNSLFPIGMSAKGLPLPRVLLLGNNYREYPIDPNKVFTLSMVTYFTITLNDENGFLAQKLGGTGLVEVVVTDNDIDDMGKMITFKKGDNYYSCLSNGGSSQRATFSSHKYVEGFNLIKNMEQENFEFKVHYEGEKVVGFECAVSSNGTYPTIHNVDDATLIENFCIVLFTKQYFTINELEAFYKADTDEAV